MALHSALVFLRDRGKWARAVRVEQVSLLEACITFSPREDFGNFP